MNQAARRGRRDEAVGTGARAAAQAPGKQTQIGSLPIARRVEAVTGADLSGVSVHADDRAAAAAQSEGARAFAKGQDVYFGAGELRPGTRDGDFLIAHELAHTVQQRAAPSVQLFSLASGSGPDAAEHEANEIARRAVDGGAPMDVSARPTGVARYTNDEAKGCASQQAEVNVTDHDRDGWDDRFTTRKTYTGLSMDQYEGLIGQNGSGLHAIQDASATKGGKRVDPIEISEAEIRTIAAASGDPTAADRAVGYLPQLNSAFVTMGIDTAQAQADYLAHTFGEMGMKNFEELDKTRDYAPFLGRGPVQVTHEYGYVQALAFLDARAKQLAAQATAKAQQGAAAEEIAKLRAEADLCTEAFTAIKADITEAANPRFAFLLSAAHMHETGAVEATATLGASAQFVGNGTADSWVSGGNAGMTFADRKAKADKEGNAQLSSDMQSATDRGAVKQAVYAAAMSTLSAKVVKP